MIKIIATSFFIFSSAVLLTIIDIIIINNRIICCKIFVKRVGKNVYYEAYFQIIFYVPKYYIIVWRVQLIIILINNYSKIFRASQINFNVIKICFAN